MIRPAVQNIHTENMCYFHSFPKVYIFQPSDTLHTRVHTPAKVPYPGGLAAIDPPAYSATRTSVLPKLPPLSISMKAAGAFSRPSVTLSRYLRRPSRI